VNTFAGYPLIDPRSVREDRARFRREMLGPLERANSLYVPSGRWASRGWFLMARSDYSNVNKFSTELQLSIGQLPTLFNLSIVQAQCVTRGLASDPNAIYLVEITDDRGILFNQWFQLPLISQYNIRAPAYQQGFCSGSLNIGTPWTWGTMLQDMWDSMNTLAGGNVLGPWPGLPIVPTATPEGFWFTGVPGWTLFNDVIEYLGMEVACDLTKAAPFTIVVPGVADPAFAAATVKYSSYIEDDLEWLDAGAGRVPATVVVLFRRRNSYYGTEETVRNDALQWSTDAVYQVSVPAPVAFSSAVGMHYIWTDFTVRYDEDSNPVAADVATATVIAQERVLQYFAKVYRQTLGFMTQTYSGALPFSTGPQVDGVRWYQTGEDGWRTQIVRGAYPPWPDLWDVGPYVA
jgi:hypothetical protein